MAQFMSGEKVNGTGVLAPHEDGLAGAAFGSAVVTRRAPEFPGNPTPDNRAAWNQYLAQFVGGILMDLDISAQTYIRSRIHSISIDQATGALVIDADKVFKKRLGGDATSLPSYRISMVQGWTAELDPRGAVVFNQTEKNPVVIAHRTSTSPYFGGRGIS